MIGPDSTENKEIERDDYDKSVFAREKAFKRRFRLVERDELAALKNRIARATESGVSLSRQSREEDQSGILFD